jgi:hypothetical protein
VLERMDGLTHLRVLGIVVEEEKGVGALGVRVALNVVGVGVVRPVLLQPEVLAAADEVGS